jgi:uncharacterized membrane protein required for colicin V production
VVAAALIRGVALAPLASVPTARMGAPIVASIVVVALTVFAICRDLIASSGLVSVSALLGFLFLGLLKLLVVVINLVFLMVRVLRWLATSVRLRLPPLSAMFTSTQNKLVEKTCKTRVSRHTEFPCGKNHCKEDRIIQNLCLYYPVYPTRY